jgi:uncharacterized protein (DUF433 family)
MLKRKLTEAFLEFTLPIVKENERITIDPGKRSGQPCIRGMRITVADVLEYLASGMSFQELLNDFPELEHEDIKASLAFAAHRERHLEALAS